MSGAAMYAAQDALVALIAADSGVVTAGAQVSLGWPSNGLTTPRMVWVNGTVEPWSYGRPVSGGYAGQGKDGTFTLRVMVLVQGPAPDYKTVRDDARTIADRVEYVVDGDRTLAGSVWHAKIVGVALDEAIPEEGKRAAAVLLDVECRAWTT